MLLCFSFKYFLDRCSWMNTSKFRVISYQFGCYLGCNFIFSSSITILCSHWIIPLGFCILFFLFFCANSAFERLLRGSWNTRFVRKNTLLIRRYFFISCPFGLCIILLHIFFCIFFPIINLFNFINSIFDDSKSLFYILVVHIFFII